MSDDAPLSACFIPIFLSPSESPVRNTVSSHFLATRLPERLRTAYNKQQSPELPAPSSSPLSRAHPLSEKSYYPPPPLDVATVSAMAAKFEEDTPLLKTQAMANIPQGKPS